MPPHGVDEGSKVSVIGREVLLKVIYCTCGASNVPIRIAVAKGNIPQVIHVAENVAWDAEETSFFCPVRSRVVFRNVRNVADNGVADIIGKQLDCSSFSGHVPCQSGNGLTFRLTERRQRRAPTLLTVRVEAEVRAH